MVRPSETLKLQTLAFEWCKAFVRRLRLVAKRKEAAAVIDKHTLTQNVASDESVEPLRGQELGCDDGKRLAKEWTAIRRARNHEGYVVLIYRDWICTSRGSVYEYRAGRRESEGSQHRRVNCSAAGASV